MDLLFTFLSNHFEVIIAFQIYFMIGMVVIAVFLRIRDLRLVHLQKAIREVFSYLMIIGETALLISMVYVYVWNFKPKPVIDFSYYILPYTSWAKDDLKIYFIADQELVSIQPDGSNRKVIFKGEDLILSYQFSPDGQDILIVTENELNLYRLKDKTAEQIETLGLSKEAKQQGAKGIVGGIRFSPDGSKFCYRVAKWSAVSSQEHWYVYDRVTKTKQQISSPTLSLSTLFWDRSGENLYYPWFEALNTSLHGNPYKVKLYKIPLATLKPEIALQFDFNESELSPEHLSTRGIDLDFRAGELSFGRGIRADYSSRSEQGSIIAIDEDDVLYYIRNRWWRRRLYQIPRVPMNSDIERYQYKGGQLAVQDLRWLPSGRYVIMEHYFFGILILDPENGNLGILDNQRGHTFGWYSVPSSKTTALNDSAEQQAGE